MNVAIKNLITGIGEASLDAGRHPGWPNEKVAAAVIEKIAAEWNGPELLNEQLSKEAALEIEDRLVKAAQAIATQHKPGDRQKTASVEDLRERAASAAAFWMDKHAFDMEVKKVASGPGSLTSVGPNTLQDAANTDQMAQLDLANRPVGSYEQPQGADTTMPTGGASGMEIPAPNGPSVSPSIENSLIDHSMKAASAAVSELDLFRQLKTAGLTEAHAEMIAKAAKSDLPKKTRMPTDSQLKAASDTLNEADNAALTKAAGLGADAKVGVVVLLADRLHKIAQNTSGVPVEIVKQAQSYAAAPINKRAGLSKLEAMKAGLSKLEAMKKTLKSKGMPEADATNVAKEAAYINQLAHEALGYKGAADEQEDNVPSSGPDASPVVGEGPASPDAAQADAQSDARQEALLEKIWAAIQQLAPQSDDAQTAAAGLLEHPEGMNVMASIAKEAKTTEDADRMLCEVLAKNPQLKKTATVESYKFVKKAFEKTASTGLVNLLKQSGAGSLTSVGPNTLADAAKTNELAALDKKNRPAGYAETEQGKAPVAAPPDTAEIKDAPRDGVPQVKGDNVVVREDKRAGLSAEDNAYFSSLSKIASEYGASFPTTWDDARKTAALQTLLALPPSLRTGKLAELITTR